MKYLTFLILLTLMISSTLFAEENIKLGCRVAGTESLNGKSYLDEKKINEDITVEVLFIPNEKSNVSSRPKMIISVDGESFRRFVINYTKDNVIKVIDNSDKNTWDILNILKEKTYSGNVMISIDRNSGSIRAKSYIELESGALQTIYLNGSCDKVNTQKRKF